MFSNYEINQIKRSESREDFKKVLQSYFSENYKASILLLYNITTDDLYYKLKLMNDRKYLNLNQELNKIEQLFKNTSKYSQVEEEIYKIYKERNLLNHDTIDVLEFFKKIRNKCAHPSFFKEENYNPRSEEVYMIIQRIYSDILIIETFIKDPYEKLIKNDIKNRAGGNIIDVIIGEKNHKKNYEIFKQYYTNKYLEKLTDNNIKKLFNTLITLTLIKKEKSTIINQYKHMMLMESIIDYLNSKGKIGILYNKYNWENLKEETLTDDNDIEVYNREWFALTYFYIIIKKIPYFMDEIKAQNIEIFNYAKEKILTEIRYIVNYWDIFYKDFDEVIDKIKDKDIYFYEEILKDIKILRKNQINKILCMMIKKIPPNNGFDETEIVCDALISQIKEMNLKNEDLDEILFLMNNNEQIYSKDRENSKLQLQTIHKLGISLEKYNHLKSMINKEK